LDDGFLELDGRLGEWLRVLVSSLAGDFGSSLSILTIDGLLLSGPLDPSWSAPSSLFSDPTCNSAVDFRASREPGIDVDFGSSLFEAVGLLRGLAAPGKGLVGEA
jgi:hypothetical protein